MIKRFISLAVVNVISNLMIPIAGLIDTAFLGHLDNISYLAGVALASVIFNYIYWTFGFLRMGTTGTVAQAKGREDSEEIVVILLRNCAIALTISIVILVLQVPIRELGFTILNGESDVINSARSYYNALIYGAPATLLNFVLLGWLLGMGKSRQVLLLSVIDKVANVALNYLFIVRLGLLSGGAGLATAISQYISLLVGLALVLPAIDKKLFHSNSQKIWEYSALKKVFFLNADIFIRTFALVSTFSLFTNISATIGTNTLATNTLLLQVVTLAAYFIDGIAFATETIVGYLQGKQDYKQLFKISRIACFSSLLIGISIAALFIIFPQALFSILTKHDNVINQINTYVFWLFPILTFGSVAYMLDGYFLGLTAGKILRNSTLIACTIGFLPVSAIAFHLQSSHLLWLALSCFMATRTLTLGFKWLNNRYV